MNKRVLLLAVVLVTAASSTVQQMPAFADVCPKYNVGQRFSDNSIWDDDNLKVTGKVFPGKNGDSYEFIIDHNGVEVARLYVNSQTRLLTVEVNNEKVSSEVAVYLDFAGPYVANAPGIIKQRFNTLHGKK